MNADFLNGQTRNNSKEKRLGYWLAQSIGPALLPEIEIDVGGFISTGFGVFMRWLYRSTSRPSFATWRRYLYPSNS
jgi:hypothetical protein